MCGFTDMAIYSVNTIRRAPSLEEAIQKGNNLFPGMPVSDIESIYHRTVELRFSDDGNTVYVGED